MLYNQTLRSNLKRVYWVNFDMIEVLMVSGIHADEYSAGKIAENMTIRERDEWGIEDEEVTKGRAKSSLHGINVTTRVGEREEILQAALDNNIESLWRA